MAGAVGGSTGALHRRAFTELGRVAAKRALIDAAVLGARKRHAVMFQLINRLRGLARQIFHRIGIAQPVATP